MAVVDHPSPGVDKEITIDFVNADIIERLVPASPSDPRPKITRKGKAKTQSIVTEGSIVAEALPTGVSLRQSGYASMYKR